jgi:electron transfer flavoprotein beta subunit
MKILVGIKRVVDYNVRVRVLPDGSGVDTDGVKMSVNPFDEIALEEALRIKEARAFLKIIEREQPGLVILGKQAIDDDNSQTGQMLAALWDRPQATFASKLTLSDGSATVVREVDIGLETIEIDLPAVVTVDLRLNEPRFVKLPDIMKAKRKPLDVVPLEDLDVGADSNLSVTKFAPPAQRAKGIMVEDAAQLVQELKNRGLV